MHKYFPSSSATTAAVMASPRENRLTSENRRIRHNASCIIAADPRIVNFGPDPIIDQLMGARGIDPREAFSLRLLLASPNGWNEGQSRRTAVLVSSRFWHRTSERSLLSEVKHQALTYNIKCILVPQRSLASPIRLASAKMIADARHVKCSTTDRLRIISHLHGEGGWSSLAECANQIRHTDPAGVVLAMVAKGDLKVDRRRPLGPHSRIDCNI